jgi:pyruvate carboxylase
VRTAESEEPRDQGPRQGNGAVGETRPAPRRFRRLLVANRGEVAIRVFRACTELGIHTIGIYAHEDRYALHRVKADEAYEVGRGLSPVGAYLDAAGIVELAVSKGADAIHPGYGFLAENADFARRCAEAGIAFVGPPPELLDLFGDKARAREAARAADLPIPPGLTEPVEGPAALEAALAFAEAQGYPVMVKAVLGGGGRGIRLARDAAELRDAVERAGSEARAAFGSGALYVEAAIERPKHIEVQVLGDAYGNVVHLYERDCSVQRRHQKLVEVAPAFGLAPEVRAAIVEAAVRLMRGVRYCGAGTVEFLVSPHGAFYFLEVNPRLQVEHTVTELVTEVDLVQAQIRVAEGYPLASPEIGIPDQASVHCRGHAIQCRVTTEDPKANFAPDVGRILTYRSPGGFGIRLDSAGAETGAVITPYYDSLLVKCSAWAPTFQGVAAKMHRALGEFRIRGVRTNLRFLMRVVANPEFRAGRADTGFVDRTPSLLAYTEPRDRGNKLLRYIAEVTVNGAPWAKGAGTSQVAAAPTRAPETRTGLSALATPPRPGGLRPLLLHAGPAGVIQQLRASPRLWITDTTFRDAHQSLLATRVRTADLAQAAAAAAYAPELFSIEAWGGATFDAAMRFLRESPWERLRLLRAVLPDTLLQMLLRGSNAVGYANYPDNVVRAFVAEAAEAGIDVFRIFDSLNWVEGMKVAIEAALGTGRLVEGAICYSGDCASPQEDIYTLDYYVALARELEAEGVHLLAIKDMAGLLTPRAAAMLVRALRQSVRLPIHLHTHDTAACGVAVALAAADAGVDIVDAAVASMAGATSQPSITAIAAALRGQPRDTGLDLAHLDRAAEHWARVRGLYGAFESQPGAGAPGVYFHEMPGGQYSNLRAQAEAVGLGGRWSEIVAAYSAVDRLLGRIVKVTPSSKAVGDFALFLVQQGLAAEELGEERLADPEHFARISRLDFPESVVQLLQGQMGQNRRGFPPRLQAAVLRGRPAWSERPGAVLPPADIEGTQQAIAARLGHPVGRQEALSAILYERPFWELQEHLRLYGDTSALDTATFLGGMRPGDELEVDIEPGKTLVVRMVGIGDAGSDGRRPVYFELNGTPREIVVVDRAVGVGGTARPAADPTDPDQVGSTMPGRVVKVVASRGQRVQRGDALVVVEAMKMETTLKAPHEGEVTALTVAAGDTVRPGDLVAVVRRKAANANGSG